MHLKQRDREAESGKGSKIGGTICLLINIPVLVYHGFIAFFFAMGGSRQG